MGEPRCPDCGARPPELPHALNCVHSEPARPAPLTEQEIEGYRKQLKMGITFKEDIERLLAEIARLRGWSDHLEGVRSDLERRVERLRDLYERLKLEAQIHAQEARAQKATVLECYQIVTEGKGEPGDWNGAEPVREAFERLRGELAEMSEWKDVAKDWRAERDRYKEALEEIAEHDPQLSMGRAFRERARRALEPK